jgi:ATP-binding cassette subfamily B protein
VLQPLIVELCRNEIVQAQPGHRIVLRVERHSNHARVNMLGTGSEPAKLSQAATQHIDASLAAAGGSFTLMPLQGRLAYVAMLPLHAVADSESNIAPTKPPGGTRPLDNLFVMAIDDQEEARDALEAVLGASGARVQVASSGAEALKRLSHAQTNQWPQVLLCDIVLADEDGYEVLRRLRALKAERNLSPESYLPAVALTGYAEVEDRLRVQQAGFQAHLSKPVSPDRLIIEIRKLTSAHARANEGQ